MKQREDRDERYICEEFNKTLAEESYKKYKTIERVILSQYPKLEIKLGVKLNVTDLLMSEKAQDDMADWISELKDFKHFPKQMKLREIAMIRLAVFPRTLETLEE